MLDFLNKVKKTMMSAKPLHRGRGLGWVFFVLLFTACGSKQPKPAEQPQAAVVVPAFNADSAYHYTAALVAFGPRVPNC